MNNEKVKQILDQIQSDLVDYQNERGIGMMDDKQWQECFIRRVIESITQYENIGETAIKRAVKLV